MAKAQAQSAPRRLPNRARREATALDKRTYYRQFQDAKDEEAGSWFKNDVYELIDMRKQHIRNYVTGRWVLTVKRDKDGKFLKVKARWVLRGFQDRRQMTDRSSVISFTSGTSGLINIPAFANSIPYNLQSNT